MKPRDKAESNAVWEDLIIAMLAVGGHPAGKVLAIRDSLDEAGLLDPRNLAAWGAERVTRDLYAAGYKRGMLTGKYAERLVAAMSSLAAGDSLKESESVLSCGQHDEIAALLLPQAGIGPKVLETFESLRARRGAPATNKEPE